MIVLLLTPGISVLPEKISDLVRRLSWLPDVPPRIVSSMTFDEPSTTQPDSPRHLISSQPIPDQCRLAIQEAIAPLEDQTESKTICRIVWITGDEIGESDALAVAALFSVCARQFTAKSVLVLGTEGPVACPLLSYCLPQMFSLEEYLGSESSPRDIVAIGLNPSKKSGLFAITASSTAHLEDFEADFAKSSLDKMTMGDLIEMDQTTAKSIPQAIMVTNLTLHVSFIDQLSSGITYRTLLNERWFSLVKVVDRDNVIISIAPQVFLGLCLKIAEKGNKPSAKEEPILVPASQRNAPGKENGRGRSSNPFIDNTISLAGWKTDATPAPAKTFIPPTSSAYVDPSSVKEQNKKSLKKHLLLALYTARIDKTHPHFMFFWKHAYIGSLYCLRDKLTTGLIDQDTLRAAVSTNLSSLDIH